MKQSTISNSGTLAADPINTSAQGAIRTSTTALLLMQLYATDQSTMQKAIVEEKKQIKIVAEDVQARTERTFERQPKNEKHVSHSSRPGGFNKR